MQANSAHFALASRLQQIEPFHVMELIKMAAALEEQGRSVIHMGIGEPDFSAAQPVLDAATAAIAAGKTRYTHATGLPELREAISQHYLHAYGIAVPASRIIITAGASGALLLACAALVERGSEVLMPDPSYPCNRHFVSAFEGVPQLIPSGPAERFQLSAALVEKHWRTATRGVLLASPSNPTGTSIDKDELARIVHLVRERQGFTLVDEIYQGLTYDAPPYSALALGADVIVINSFSKYFNMTGWRLGWIVVPPALLPAVEKLAQNMFICASSIAQHAALACFTPQSLAIFEERKAEFHRRRDFIVPALRDLGLTVPVTPDGAFYVYADCSAFSQNADALTKDILHKTGVVMVPGLDFGPHTAGHYIRVSYSTAMPQLEEAVRRLRAYFYP